MRYWINCNIFVVRSVDFPELFRITSFFSWVEAVMSLMLPILGLSGAVPRFFSFSLFIACIILVAQNFVELQSEREWVENESVDKDYPQKTILEIHCCNQHYPLKISSQNNVFVPEELSRASRKGYVFAPYQFHNTFLGNPESVHGCYVEHTMTDSKNQCLWFSLQFGFRWWRRSYFVLRGLVELGFWCFQFVSRFWLKTWSVSIPSYICSFIETVWANFSYCAPDTPSQMGCVIR